MNDTPGWSSPGSAPSDGQEPGASGPADAAGRPGPAQPADRPGEQPQTPGVKWSKEQPPPGQWSAPTGTPAPGRTPSPPPPAPGWGQAGYGAPGGYGGYGGPGGHGAWGAGWGGLPPAAKPGVIPLRPLGLGEILDGAVTTMRTHWRTVLGISLVVAVLVQTIVTLVQRFVFDDATNQVLNDPNATFREVSRAMGNLLLGSGVAFIVQIVGIIVATGLLATVTSRAALGKPVTIGEAWRDARPQVLKLFGLVFLLLLISVGIVAVGVLPGIIVAATGSPLGGVALAFLGGAAAFVPAVWLWIRFCLAPPALMLEKQSITKAMSRSGKLVRGSWWRLFGIQLLTVLITFMLSVVIALPFAMIALVSSGDGMADFINGTPELSWTYLVITGIGSVIGLAITFPILANVTVLLYIDQRIRREGLDLELARAAGVPSHGSGATTPGS
ncbi:glycerophosphoryl diester phosphodiesterase membrane domain-containing protein [Streptomyces kebangsaanensis]|uniref:glycerophosphoryl diester phosphodiesterase membrane domain-containing protein n=1 Tax=Streptomyces kebangsaanensis TaxID=864058 RepID=UPI00093AC19E|nr:glycerophosphoryl diester phosphodiesterase membrane domain-containing protein [Streptomyces kebangsaanensis]